MINLIHTLFRLSDSNCVILPSRGSLYAQTASSSYSYCSFQILYSLQICEIAHFNGNIANATRLCVLTPDCKRHLQKS